MADIIMLSVMGVCAIIIVLLQAFYKPGKDFDKYDEEPADEHFFDYNDYNTLYKYLDKRFKENNYNLYKIEKTDEYELNIYLNETENYIMDFITVFRTKEYTEELERKIEEETENFYKENKKLRYRTESFIGIVIVDRKSKTFEEYVNSGVIYSKHREVLHEGISLGGKRIYISNLSKFLNKKRYIKLKNKFKLLIGIE